MNFNPKTFKGGNVSQKGFRNIISKETPQKKLMKLLKS